MNPSLWIDQSRHHAIKRGSVVEVNFRVLHTQTLPGEGSIGTLPEGYRPKFEQVFPAAFLDAGSGFAIGYVTIEPSGNITYRVQGISARWAIFSHCFTVG